MRIRMYVYENIYLNALIVCLCPQNVPTHVILNQSVTPTSFPSVNASFIHCVDLVGWTDSLDDGCEWYESNNDPGCPNEGHDWENSTTNVTPNESLVSVFTVYV